MKPILLSIALLIYSISAFTQIPTPTKGPLPSEAFNKMIVRDITYAIVGESTPVSGLKVDVSKPEGTISVLFPSKKGSKVPWDILGFEFKGGATSGNFTILKGGNNFNTAFELKPSFHFIPTASKAKYGVPKVAASKTAIIEAKNKLVKKYGSTITDTFYATALIRKHHLDFTRDLVDHDISLPPDSSINEAQKKVIIYFIKKIMKNENLNISASSSVQEILKNLPKASIDGAEINTNNYYDEVEEDYKKYQKLYKNLDDEMLNKMITNASEVWTKKVYYWFTASPFARTEKISQYYTQYKGKDSLYFNSDYPFYYGITGYFNIYTVYPNKIAHLFRVGVSLSRSNNLSSLSSFNYETRSPFFAYGNTVTEKTKSGTAYNNSEINTGFAKQLDIEYYLLPLKSLFPGIYISSNLNQSKLYKLPSVVGRENDKMQLGLEGGLVFNINSREKDKEKSVLSILAYFRHEDLTDKLRTDVKTMHQESREDFRKRNFSIGIRVGIPINLTQVSN